MFSKRDVTHPGNDSIIRFDDLYAGVASVTSLAPHKLFIRHGERSVLGERSFFVKFVSPSDNARIDDYRCVYDRILAVQDSLVQTKNLPAFPVVFKERIGSSSYDVVGIAFA